MGLRPVVSIGPWWLCQIWLEGKNALWNLFTCQSKVQTGEADGLRHFPGRWSSSN